MRFARMFVSPLPPSTPPSTNVPTSTSFGSSVIKSGRVFAHSSDHLTATLSRCWVSRSTTQRIESSANGWVAVRSCRCSTLSPPIGTTRSESASEQLIPSEARGSWRTTCSPASSMGRKIQRSLSNGLTKTPFVSNSQTTNPRSTAELTQKLEM